MHGLYQSGTLEKVAESASHTLPERFDIIILGMGDDGHTASLFEIPNELNTRTGIIAVKHSPKPPAERLSLSYDSINSAQHIIVLITGIEKKSVYIRYKAGDMALPITHIQPDPGELTMIVERALAT